MAPCLLLLALLGAESAPASGALALTRFGYGPRGSQRAALERTSWSEVIEKQLAFERIDDAAATALLTRLDDVPASPAEQIARFPKPSMLQKGMERMGIDRMPVADVDKPGELIQALQARRVVRAVASERQLYEAMVEFWLDHFNVFARKRGVMYAITAYEDGAVRPHALGKFEDLLVAVASSSAMAEYLDNDDNVRPNAPWPMQAIPDDVDLRACKYLPEERIEKLTRRASKNKPAKPGKEPKRERGINENYARELLELHTLGVDGGYTQKDVSELARVFTGWTVFDPEGSLGCKDSGRAVFVPELHDGGEKTVLGTVLAGAGRDEGLKVLHMLAEHPATARFIATKLVRRFVNDAPPAALVDKVAARFVATHGDLRAVMKTLALDPLTIAAARAHVKVKRPFDLVVSSLRALDADTDGRAVNKRFLGTLNQQPYAWQTPNGYPEEAGRWTNVGALTQRLKFGIALAGNTIQGTAVDLAKLVGAEMAYGGGNAPANELVDTIAARLLGAGVSKGTRETIIAALGDVTPAATPPDGGDQQSIRANVKDALADKNRTPDPRVARAVGLLLGSPEFQHR